KAVSPKHVERTVIGVGPNSELRIIIEVLELVFIACVLAWGVVRRGDRSALRTRSLRHGELRKSPAIGLFVIKYDRITIITSLTIAAKPAPQQVSVNRAEHALLCFLVEDREAGIHPLHVVGLANGP